MSEVVLRFLLLLLGIACHSLQASFVPPTQITLGGFFPITGPWPVGDLAQPGFQLAIKLINERNDILPETELLGFYNDTKCDAGSGLAALVFQRERYDIDALIGGGCSTSCSPNSLLAKMWKLPHISWGCSSPALSNKAQYPYFMRTVAPDLQEAAALVEICLHFGWTRVGTANDLSEIFSLTMNHFLDLAEQNGITVLASVAFPVDVDHDALHGHVETLKQAGVKVVVATTYSSVLVPLMIFAKETGLVGEGSQLISESSTFLSTHESLFSKIPEGRSNQDLLDAMVGVMVNSPAVEYDDDYNTFVATFEAEFGSTPALYALMSHDAVMAYARAADTLIKTELSPRENSEMMLEEIKGSTFKGVSGEVSFNAEGDRNGKFTVGNVQVSTGDTPNPDLVPIGVYDANSGLVMDTSAAVVFSGGTSEVPSSAAPVYQCTELDRSYNVSGCVASKQKRVSTFYWLDETLCSDFELPPPVEIDCDHVEVSSSVGSMVTAFSIAGVIAGVVSMGIILAFKSKLVFKLSQLPFLMIFTIGASIACLSSLVLLGSNTASRCLLEPWAFHISFTCMFGPMLVKIWRAYRILDNAKLKKIRILNSTLYKHFCVLLLLDVAILLVWTLFDKRKSVLSVRDEPGVGAVTHRECKSDGSAIATLALFYKVSMLLMGVNLAWKTRDMSSAFSEAKHLMVAMYNVALISALVLLLTEGMDVSVQTRVMLQGIGIVWCAVLSLLVVIGPKVVVRNSLTDIAQTSMGPTSLRNKSGGNTTMGPTVVVEQTSLRRNTDGAPNVEELDAAILTLRRVRSQMAGGNASSDGGDGDCISVVGGSSSRR